MSIKIMNLVWENSSAMGTELLLMLAIADFADDDGRAYPGVTRLAKKCKASKSTIQRAIKSRIKAKELSVDYNKGIETGHGKTNLYQININKLRGVNLTSLDDGVAHVTPQGVAHVTPQGVAHVTPKPSVEPSVESSDENSRNGDYLTAIVLGQDNISETTSPNPLDQHLGNSRDSFLKAFEKIAERVYNQTEKQAIIDLANGSGDLALWKKSLRSTMMNWSGNGKAPISRMINVYKAGGDYKKAVEKEYEAHQPTSYNPTPMNMSQDDLAAIRRGDYNAK